MEIDMLEWKPYYEWVEFAGKVLVFASFWLVAPEIMGEERLRNLSKATLSTLATLAGFVGWLVTLFLASVLLGVMLPDSMNPFISPSVHEGLLAPPTNPFSSEIRRAIGPIIMVLALGAGRLTRGWIEDQFVRPTVSRLAESRYLRSLCLRIGVFLFVLGSVFDMGWWLWEKKVRKLRGFTESVAAPDPMTSPFTNVQATARAVLRR